MIGQQFGIQTGFNMPIQKPANKFPGFSEKQIQQLYKDTANIPIEKRAEVQYQLYKEILPQIKTNELKDKRIEVKANIYNDSLEERDVLKKNISQAQLRMEDLADQVKDKFNLIPTAPTNEVLDGFSKLLADKRIDPKLVEDYINGKSEELLYVSGLKDRPVEETSFIKDIGEGLTNFAGGLPKIIGETGLLDKPMLGLANIIRKIKGKEPLTEDEIQSFSDYVGGSQVGGDPESSTAKAVEYGADTLAALSGVPALAKGISKQVAKQGAKKTTKIIGEIISEPETTKTVQKAIKEKRLVEGTSGRIKRQLFGEKGAEIMPTKQIDEAVEIIKKNIEKPSKTPSGLFNQLTDFIENKSKVLSDKLKQIKIDKTWDKAEIKLNLKELAKNTDEFTQGEIKNINKFSNRINEITDLDELWKLRKEFDDMFSDAIKQASDISAPATRRANKLWKATRNILNNKLNEISETVGDLSTKQEFKEMSAILNAKGNIIEKSGVKMLKPTQGIISKKNIIKAGAGYLGYKAVEGLVQ